MCGECARDYAIEVAAVKSSAINQSFQCMSFAYERCESGLSALAAETDGLRLVATMAAARHPLRSYILSLFRHGDLVSVVEAVQICGASRQAISKWLKAEKLDIASHRMQRIAAYATNAQLYLEGLPPTRQPTKAQMRKSLEAAVKRFNDAQAAKQGLQPRRTEPMAPQSEHGSGPGHGADVDIDL